MRDRIPLVQQLDTADLVEVREKKTQKMIPFERLNKETPHERALKERERAEAKLILHQSNGYRCSQISRQKIARRDK